VFLRVGWVAHIILNSSPFEEGAIWIGFIVSFLQRSLLWNGTSENHRVILELLSAIKGELPDKAIIKVGVNEIITLSVDGAPTSNESDLRPPLPEFDPRILNELEYAGGTVRLSDKFYVERDEDYKFQSDISAKTRRIITIKAPRSVLKNPYRGETP